MQLFFRRYGNEGDQPVIILHGLFGISDNWVSYARRLSQEGFEVFVPDQRNHGQSPKSDNFNYLALTDDLFDFIDDNEIEDPIIIGHSMGGKVAMRFALENPLLVKKLVVVDITLKAYGPRKQHLKIIEAMKTINLKEISQRSEAEEQLAKFIPEKKIQLFILKNLHRLDKDEFEWRLNFEGIEKSLKTMFDAINTSVKFNKPTLFIKGGASDYILLEDFEQIKYNFPNAEIVTIENASHWVHVEAAEKFYQLTSGFATGSPSWYEKMLREEEDGISVA
ncbi:MAG: alpha/beta hydrolase [Marinilabiliales bacterium]|nr:MAG: alpha/beta hydrolase [Marinilabiliales bacterium]